jgi:hypothetical protein
MGRRELRGTGAAPADLVDPQDGMAPIPNIRRSRGHVKESLERPGVSQDRGAQRRSCGPAPSGRG